MLKKFTASILTRCRSCYGGLRRHERRHGLQHHHGHHGHGRGRHRALRFRRVLLCVLVGAAEVKGGVLTA
jgi:hypothetical protein